MIDNFWGILRSIRIQDVFDIAIITIMIFVLLNWFKDRASRFVLVGISLLGVVYILARFFQLYLTTIALQGFFAILLFVLVVIFQEDFRRFFERLAVWGIFRRKTFDAMSHNLYAEIIANAAVNLARNRYGALIVMRGKDPLDRHLEGGTELNGLLSRPLLESIFDPHSIGHDGAVLIEGNRVLRFGCHLPLSVNLERYPHIGLRHAAALGLTERSDAICIVVSEERGSISVVSGEKLNPIENTTTLIAALESFYEQNAPQGKPRPFTFIRWLKENPREKVIAVLLACIIWFAFGYQRETVRRDFNIPIEYINVSHDWIIEEPKILEAKVTLIGSSQGFQLLDLNTLKVVLNLSQLQEGRQEIALTKEMVDVPSNLSVAGVKPNRIEVLATRIIPVSYPVEVITENSPAKGLIVQRITVKPPSVKVLVPGRLRHKIVKIQTEPIDLKPLTSSITVRPKLIFPALVQFLKGKPPSVKVSINLKKKNVQVRS